MKPLFLLAILLSALLFSCKPDPVPEPEPEPQPSKYEKNLKPYVDSLLRAEGLPGMAVSVVDAGDTAWHAGFGFQSLGTPATPVSQTTRFLLGSTADAVVAAAVMQARAESGLDLDASINAYLPFAVRHPDFPTAVITLRMLLTHTAGLTDNDSLLRSFYGPGDAAQRLRDFLRSYLVAGQPRYAEAHFTASRPGKTFRYSRIGIALAALVVESRTGIDFDLYCKTRLFIQLGFSSVSWFSYDLQPSLLATGYARVNNAWQAQPLSGYPMYPSGQLRISSELLARYALALLNNGTYGNRQVLSPSDVSELLAVQNAFVAPGQGLGWRQDTLGGRTVAGLMGSDLGQMSLLYIEPSTGSGVVVLSNGAGNPQALRRVAARALALARQ